MNKQEEFKASLMAQMDTISKESALEGILFLMGLHNISLAQISLAKRKISITKGK